MPRPLPYVKYGICEPSCAKEGTESSVSRIATGNNLFISNQERLTRKLTGMSMSAKCWNLATRG